VGRFDVIENKKPVLEAIREFDRLTRGGFLAKYKFGKARKYWLLVNNRYYDSKAILGVAVSKAGQGKVIHRFSGGERIVKRKLESLGFKVVQNIKRPSEVNQILNEKDLRVATRVAVSELRRLASVDSRFVVAKTVGGKPHSTATDGIYMKCGELKLGRRRVDLELSIERYARESEYDFWFGIRANAEATAKALANLLEEQGKRVAHPLLECNALLVNKKKSYYRLKKPLSRADWGKIFPEFYSGEYYVGQYAPKANLTASLFGMEGAAFWSSIGRATILEEEILEGTDRQKSSRARKRSSQLRRAAIKHFTKGDCLECRACSFSAPLSNSMLSVIEFHHVRPLATYDDRGMRTTISAALENLMPLCPTCHRIAHRNGEKPLTVAQLKEVLRLA